jgi:hypothetical protein
MATPELPQELLFKLAGQVIQDPGVPLPNPTIPAWQEPPHPLATTQSKDLPKYTDFAIIGSGITGCSAAKTILENELGIDKTVTMFEARSLTTGATSRNGGYLLSHAPKFYEKFVEAFGATAAKQIAKFCDQTLDELMEVAKAENLLQISEIREVTTVLSFEDVDGFESSCRSVRMYEEAVPDRKEKYTIIDGEAAMKVRHPRAIQLFLVATCLFLSFHRNTTSKRALVLFLSRPMSSGHTNWSQTFCNSFLQNIRNNSQSKPIHQ